MRGFGDLIPAYVADLGSPDSRIQRCRFSAILSVAAQLTWTSRGLLSGPSARCCTTKYHWWLVRAFASHGGRSARRRKSDARADKQFDKSVSTAQARFIGNQLISGELQLKDLLVHLRRAELKSLDDVGRG